MGSVTRDFANSIGPGKTVSTGINFRNLIINGDMSIAQRATSTSSITGNGYHTIDRYQSIITNQGTWTQSQSTDVPSGQGFVSSFKWDCTTADASPAADDRVFFGHKIEGQNLQYLKKGTSNAESLTLSFWVKSNKTGTYIIDIQDEDNGRQISQAYTISSASTWEKKTLTFDGDTSGTLDDDNATSLAINFWLGGGSTYTGGTLNTTWGTEVTANRAVGQVNLADNTSNEWYITGIQLETGTTATNFEFLPFDINLQRCQRYYYAHAVGGQVIGLMWWYQSGVNNTVIHFPVEMRSAPSVSTTSGSGYYRVLSNGSATDFDSLSGLQDGSPHATTIDSGLSGTGSQVGRVKCNNDGRVLFSSEL